MAQAEADKELFQLPKTMGRRVRYFRLFRGDELTQDQLAAMTSKTGVKMSRFMLNRIEKDERRPTLSQALALARVLGVAPVDLGVTVQEYPEIRFLKDPETRAALEATPSYRRGKSTGRQRRTPAERQLWPAPVKSG